jgi:hypothetical protein
VSGDINSFTNKMARIIERIAVIPYIMFSSIGFDILFFIGK